MNPSKVSQILRMLQKNRLQPKARRRSRMWRVEVLRLLQKEMDRVCHFWGYEISPQAPEMCKSRANERLQFKLADIS